MPLSTVTFDSLVTSLIQRSGRDRIAPTISNYPDIQALLNHRLQEIWDYPGNGWDFLREIAILNKTDVLYATGFELAGTDAFYRKNAAQVNSKNAYTYTGDQTIEWDGVTKWQIFGSDDAAVYEAAEDVATPDLVETWTAVGNGTTPVGDVVVGSYHTIDLSDGKQVHGVFAEDPRQSPTANMLRTEILVGGELRVSDNSNDKVYYIYTPEMPDWIADDPVPTVYKVFRAAAIELAYSDMQGMKNDANPGLVKQLEARGYRMLDELCNRYARMHTMPAVGISHGHRSHRSSVLA